MKRTAVILLAAFMLFAGSVSAFAAVSSVVAPVVNPEITTDLPEIVEGNLGVKTVDELTVEEQAVYEEAIASLIEEIPPEMTVQYLNYVSASEEYTSSITLDMHNIENLETKQLVNDEWVDVTVTQDGDVYSVTLADDVSVVSFMLDEETGRPTAQMINGEWENIDELGNEEGIYTIVVSTSYPASVTVNLENTENARAMQFINGKWVEVETVRNPDGTYTITVNGPGFVAFVTE